MRTSERDGLDANRIMRSSRTHTYVVTVSSQCGEATPLQFVIEKIIPGVSNFKRFTGCDMRHWPYPLYPGQKSKGAPTQLGMKNLWDFHRG
jgi:hypothetical protein